MTSLRSSRQPAVPAGEWQWQFTLLVLLTLAAWAPALGGRFQYDDLPNIVLDRATSDPAVLIERLANGFRPLLRLSYSFDFFLWGFRPAAFLATNLFLHLLTVVLVWRLARRRLVDPTAAFVAALVFSLQPAHGAAVAWASGRSSILSTLFLAGALLWHERAVIENRPRWHGASIVLFCLAAASKEVALIFPALVWLWEITREPRPAHPEIARRVAPSAVAAIALLALIVSASSRLRELLLFSIALASPARALTEHLSAVPQSLTLWFRPWALSVEHAQPALHPALGAVVLAALVAVSLANVRRRPIVSLALLWPLVALLPSHSFIARLDPIVEKPLYAAWIGPSLALGSAAAALLRSGPIPVARVIAAGSLVALFAAAGWRARIWADPAALWREATEAAPMSARAWRNRAVAGIEARESPVAVDEWLARARSFDPDAPQSYDLEIARRLSRISDEDPARR